MSAGEQQREQGRNPSHGASLAQKLVGWLALACACDDGTSAPPVDPDDLDGDGIPNAQDRCPGVNDPAQHDEDGDGVGDLCDVCPTVPDPLQLDRGELDSIAFDDGVGDACDPRPTRGGDQIGALHTFVEGGPWIGEGWTIADDRVHASALGSARWRHPKAMMGDGMTARLAIESIAWAPTGGRIAVSLDGDGLESGGVCELFQDRDADGSDELEVRELGGATRTRELLATVDGPIVLIAQRAIDRFTGTGTITCRLHELDETGALTDEVALTIATSDDATTGQYVISAEDADLTATSLLVYKAPVGCIRTARAACPGPDPP